jgi:hypothetical protein
VRVDKADKRQSASEGEELGEEEGNDESERAIEMEMVLFPFILAAHRPHTDSFCFSK